MLDHEVADADGADLAVLEQRLQRPVCLERLAEVGRQRLVQDQQVDLVDAELAGALVEGVQRLVISVVADPDLGLQEDRRTTALRRVYRFADLALVAVGGGRVNVAVAGAERGRDRAVLDSAVAGATARRAANTTRFIYLDPAAREFFVDYDRVATDAAAMLRLEAGRNPHDKALITLVGELSTQSELFRQHWASHNVKFHRSGRKRLRHPAVGELDLNFEAMELSSEPGLRLNLYTADPDTPAADGLKLLASWAATRAADSTGTPEAHDVR